MKRSEYYGLDKYYGCGGFKSKSEEREFHLLFTRAFKDYASERGNTALDDFYKNWIFEELPE